MRRSSSYYLAPLNWRASTTGNDATRPRMRTLIAYERIRYYNLTVAPLIQVGDPDTQETIG